MVAKRCIMKTEGPPELRRMFNAMVYLGRRNPTQELARVRKRREHDEQRKQMMLK